LFCVGVAHARKRRSDDHICRCRRSLIVGTISVGTLRRQSSPPAVGKLFQDRRRLESHLSSPAVADWHDGLSRHQEPSCRRGSCCSDRNRQDMRLSPGHVTPSLGRFRARACDEPAISLDHRAQPRARLAGRGGDENPDCRQQHRGACSNRRREDPIQFANQIQKQADCDWDTWPHTRPHLVRRAELG